MKEKFYLGTYTKRESKGVYSVILNKETEQLENLTLEAALENPTYLYYSKENHLLFAVGKEHRMQESLQTLPSPLQSNVYHHSTINKPFLAIFDIMSVRMIY